MLDYVLHSSLNRFMRRVTAGEYLFRQGEPAETMVFVVSGRIQLIGERERGRYVESVLEAGEFLGEKVLLGYGPYPRSHSARVESEALVLELRPEDVADLESEEPGVMTELLKGILQVVAVRFDRTQQMIRILRSPHPLEKLIQLILYFAHGTPRPEGADLEVHLSVDSIHNYVDMEKERIGAILEELVDQGRLVRLEAGRYRIPDEQNLLDYIPPLTRRLVA